jgi:RNAse (barnase) inhibitor barstar
LGLFDDAPKLDTLWDVLTIPISVFFLLIGAAAY